MKLVQSIPNFLNKADKSSLVLFVGAGISLTSEVPLAHAIKSQILDSLDATQEEKQIILKSPIPFELFMETISEQIDIGEIFEIFRSNKPNKYHFLLAELLRSNYINTIVTTNFDTLIEQALSIVGLQKERDFKVLSTKGDFLSLDLKKKERRIVKLHGCISNPAEMMITLSLVANRINALDIRNIVHQIFQKKQHNCALIFGYSCSDHFDVIPSLKSVGKDISDLVLINHSEEERAIRIKRAEVSSSWPFNSYGKGRAIYGKTEIIVGQIFKEETKNLIVVPPYFDEELRWKRIINNWAASKVGKQSYKKHITGRLLIKANRFKQAIAPLVMGYESATSFDSYEKAINSLSLGICYYRQKDFSESIKWLKRAREQAKKCKGFKVEGQALGNMGNVYYSWGKLKLARKYQNKCLVISERMKLTQLRANTLGNLGIIEERAKKYSAAVKYHLKALRAAKKIGDAVSIARHKYNIALAYQYQRNYSRTKRWIQEAFSEATLTGQDELIANCHMTLGKLSMDSNNMNAAEINYLKAAELFCASNAVLNLNSCYEALITIYKMKEDVKNYNKYVKIRKLHSH